jgi:tetratricopeptide (TPR) repeat protein
MAVTALMLLSGAAGRGHGRAAVHGPERSEPPARRAAAARPARPPASCSPIDPTPSRAIRADRRLAPLPRSRRGVDALVNASRAALARARPAELGAAALTMANFGLMYQNVGQLNSAREWVDSALALAARTPERERAAAVRLLHGEVYQSLGLSEVALADYGALRAGSAPLAGDMEARLDGDLAVAFVETGVLDSALTFARQAVRLREAARDPAGSALALNNLAQVVQVLGRADSARALLCSALERSRSAGDGASETTILNNIGYAYELDGAYPASL